MTGTFLATALDLPAVAALHLAASRSAYRGILADDILDSLTLDGRLALWRARYAALGPQGRLWIYRQDDKIAGFALADRTDDNERAAAVAELVSFYVLPSFWGVGVGRRLMDVTIDHFAQRSFDWLILWTMRANNRARRFYENAGFTSDGGVRLARREESGISLEYDEMRYARALRNHTP